jgi:hypothetical protein
LFVFLRLLFTELKLHLKLNIIPLALEESVFYQKTEMSFRGDTKKPSVKRSEFRYIEMSCTMKVHEIYLRVPVNITTRR